jgi:ubiquitin C-terminal hydrolase
MIVAGNKKDFQSSLQQDALEYLQHLFDKLTKDEQNKKLKEIGMFGLQRLQKY